MFMRTVKMFVKQSEIPDFRSLYEEHTLEAFATVPGCRYAALLQSTYNPEECISLTFWTSEAEADAYEQSGEYEHLIKILSPHFSESSELQIRLTKDLKIEYSSSKDPEVRKFELGSPPESKSTGEIFLRMVSLKFREGKTEEFKKHYAENVIPVLRSVNGCRRAFLAAPSDSPNELISVTEWDNEQAAQVYEHGGQFDAILESQRHFFSGLSNWGMTGQRRTGNRVVTSDDVTIDHHLVLLGRSFGLAK
jgi:heme-degrading monooxygenase HmoA